MKKSKALLVCLVLTNLIILGMASSAFGHKHGTRPALAVSVTPAAAYAGDLVTVKGKVKHVSKSSIAGYRVALRLGKGKRLSTLASIKPKSNGKYALSFHVPSTPGTLTLRLQLRKGKQRLASSKPWKLSVRARPGGGAGASSGPHTLVLAPGTIVSVPAPGEQGIVRISGQVNLAIGDVIAIGIGPNTPNGFLGKVTSVSFNGSETVVGTTPATLPEALPEGQFSQHLDGGEIDSEEEPAPLGASSSSSDSSGDATTQQRVNAVIHCQAGAQVTVKGTVSINPSIDIDAGWGPFSGLHAHFIGKAVASSELSASAEAAASCKAGPVTLFTRYLSPIEFFVGPVPVVVVPKISAYLTADGKVEASVDSEVHGSVTASAGIEYSHGSAHPVANFEKSFGWTPPDPQGNAHLGATVSPTIDLLVYGVGGPEAAFNVGLSVDADTSADPLWTLTAPISLTAKLAIPSLGISTPTLTVYQHSFLLAQAGETDIQGQIHFDELPEGTVVTDQYANEGVVFDTPVFITEDSANPTSPVLSGTPRFEGPIVGHFVKPGTNTPATVNLLQLDAGYIDNPGSVEIVATLANGQTRTAVADHLGIDQISIATRGIKSFSVQAVNVEEAGFAIDNLGFGS